MLDNLPLPLPFALPDEAPFGAWINLRLYSGDEVIALSSLETDVKRSAVKPSASKVFTENEDSFLSDGFVIDKKNGSLKAIMKNGENLLYDESALSVWRAPVDNDGRPLPDWTKDKLRYTHEKTYSVKNENGCLTFDCSLAPVSRQPIIYYKKIYRAYDGNLLKVTLDGEIRRDRLNTFLPRLGLEMKLTRKNAAFSYIGLGPYENYDDMCHGVTFGKYESSAEKEYVPYTVPQDYGNHKKVLQFALDCGIMVIADEAFEFYIRIGE